MADQDLAKLDGALLALPEGEGSTFRPEFVELGTGFGDDGSADSVTTNAWLDDAATRGLVRIDADEGLVSITPEGRNRLIELL
jgi:hypothetical protein